MGWDELSLQLQSESDESRASHDGELECPQKRTDYAQNDSLVKKYLMDGHVMMPSVCPDCKSPLIKSLKSTPDKYEEFYEAGGFLNLEIKTVRRKRMLRKGEMIGKVPYCLSCKVVVVTSNEELMVMWEDKHKHLLVEKGAVLLDMQKEEVVGTDSNGPSNSATINREDRYPTSKEVEKNVLQKTQEDACAKQTRNGVVLLSRRVESDEVHDEKEIIPSTSKEIVDDMDVDSEPIDRNNEKSQEFIVSEPDSDDESVSSDEEDIDLEVMPYEKRYVIIHVLIRIVFSTSSTNVAHSFTPQTQDCHENSWLKDGSRIQTFGISVH